MRPSATRGAHSISSPLRRTAAQPQNGERSPRPRAPSALLTPSIFRPATLAEDRLELWTSTYGILRDLENAATLPRRARTARAKAILASVERSTRKTYSAGLLRFHEFCDSNHVAESSRMPASDFLLSSFVAHHLGKVGKSAVDNWIAGLQLWHNIHDAPWLGSRALAAASRGVAKSTPASSRRPKRAPVTIDHVRALRQRLDLSNAFDSAVYAVAAIAFRACCRLGELVLPSASGFDATRHVANDVTIHFKSTADGSQFAQFHIPFSKTTGIQGADIFLMKASDDVCAMEALRHHKAVNKAVPHDAPLFAWTTADGSWAPMTKEWFLERCGEVWRACGLEVVPGHSFRIGGTTDLLLRGVEPGIVAMQGRWTSAAFLKYWRQVELILPRFLSRAAPSVSLESIATSVTRFEAQLV